MFQYKKTVQYLILFSFLILILTVIDIIVGKLYPTISPEFGRRNLELAVADATGAKKSMILKLSPHPYLTYINTINYKKNGINQHNNLGYRNTENISIEKEKNIIRILAIGGSTTYGSGVAEPKQAWPEKLEKLLNTRFSGNKYKIRVINAGLIYGTTAEFLTHYLFKNRYLKPDIVIIHAGGNDAAPLFYENYKPDYSHWRRIKATKNTGLRSGEVRLIKYSNIIKLFYATWYSRLNYSGTDFLIQTNSFSKLSGTKALQNVEQNEPIGFQRNLDLLLRNIKNDYAIPIYFNFYLPGEEIFGEAGETVLKVANRKVNYKEFYQAISIAKIKIKNSATLICQQNNVKFVELKKKAIPINCFIDPIHVNENGHQIKAEFIYEHVYPIVNNIIKARL